MLFIASLTSLPVLAASPLFDLPIRCTPGQDCYIQNYFDRDPGPRWRDYSCGHLSYDGHTGTDIRLPDLKTMRAGVPAIAAADGTVVGLRDGVPDVPVLMKPGEPETGRYAAGNGVRIDHGDGWETQYSHMRQGSISVHMGQHVHTGDVLGLVGLSGNTEFPHVDFTVRHNGKPLDPFAPSGTTGTCDAGADTLWKPDTLKMLRYIPTGLLLAGWSGGAPDWNRVNDGTDLSPNINASALVFWIELFGAQKNDRQFFEIFGPTGNSFLKNEATLSSDKALWTAYAGKRRPPQGWQTGRYRAEYRLERNGKTIIDVTREIKLY